MVSTVLLMVVILAVATRATDAIRLREEEEILRKLPLSEAHDYYELLRRRARRVRVMRAVTLGSLVLVLLAGRRHFFGRRLPMVPAGAAHSGPPSNTEAARLVASEEIDRQVARGVIDRGQLQPLGVSGDELHPWIFEYRRLTDGGAGERVRVYIDKAGRAELHRLP
jgi:hypothetical protein